jgi:hypothetical protein
MAVVCGIARAGMMSVLDFFYLNLLFAGGAGYVTGEIVSPSVNLKRSKGLAAIGGVSVSASYLVRLWFAGFLLGAPFYARLGITNISPGSGGSRYLFVLYPIALGELIRPQLDLQQEIMPKYSSLSSLGSN